QVDLSTVAGDAHRQPAVRALLDVLALLQPELVDIEVESLVLIEDKDRCDVQLGDHFRSPLANLCETRLRSRGGVRFSKTARSRRDARCGAWPRGRHPDAVWRHYRSIRRAVVRRRFADDLAERAAEGSEAH